MKKKHWIPLLCSVVVVFFGALYIIVTFDSDKPISSLENTSKVESTPSPSRIVSSEKNFVMDGIGSFIYPYVYGVTLQKIDVNNPEIYSIKEGIKTVLVDGKKIICWYDYYKNNYELSSDYTKIAIKGFGGEENYETLFYYDSETDIKQNLSSAVVDGYDYNYYKSISLGDGFDVQWIENPKLSDDNLLVAYESNRRNYEAYVNESKQIPEEIKNNDYLCIPPYPHSDIWVIDTVTEEEYLAIEDATLLGWMGRTIVYRTYSAETEHSVYFMNIDTGEKRKRDIFPCLYEIYYSNNSCFMTSDDGEAVYYYNLTTDTLFRYLIKEEGLTVAYYELIQSDEGIYYWAIKYRTNEKTNGEYSYYLKLFNIETGTGKMYNFTGNLSRENKNVVIKGIIGENKVVLTEPVFSNIDDPYPKFIDYYTVELTEYNGQGN